MPKLNERLSTLGRAALVLLRALAEVTEGRTPV